MNFRKLTETADLTTAAASEEDKIRAMMVQSTKDYDTANYQKSKYPHPGYVCYKCGKQGHFIFNCPHKTIGNQWMTTRVKTATGIPESFLTNVDHLVALGQPGVMRTISGRAVVPTIDAMAYQQGKVERPPFAPRKKSPPRKTKIEEKIPTELLCQLCNDILTDAVVIPCCGNSYCDECVRDALLATDDHICPGCKEMDVSPDKLIANQFLRRAVQNFKNEAGYTKQAKALKEESPPPPPPPLPPRPTHQTTKSQIKLTTSVRKSALVPTSQELPTAETGQPSPGMTPASQSQSSDDSTASPISSLSAPPPTSRPLDHHHHQRDDHGHYHHDRPRGTPPPVHQELAPVMHYSHEVMPTHSVGPPVGALPAPVILGPPAGVPTAPPDFARLAPLPPGVEAIPPGVPVIPPPGAYPPPAAPAPSVFPHALGPPPTVPHHAPPPFVENPLQIHPPTGTSDPLAPGQSKMMTREEFYKTQKMLRTQRPGSNITTKDKQIEDFARELRAFQRDQLRRSRTPTRSRSRSTRRSDGKSRSRSHTHSPKKKKRSLTRSYSRSRSRSKGRIRSRSRSKVSRSRSRSPTQRPHSRSISRSQSRSRGRRRPLSRSRSRSFSRARSWTPDKSRPLSRSRSGSKRRFSRSRSRSRSRVLRSRSRSKPRIRRSRSRSPSWAKGRRRRTRSRSRSFSPFSLSLSRSRSRSRQRFRSPSFSPGRRNRTPSPFLPQSPHQGWRKRSRTPPPYRRGWQGGRSPQQFRRGGGGVTGWPPRFQHQPSYQAPDNSYNNYPSHPPQQIPFGASQAYYGFDRQEYQEYQEFLRRFPDGPPPPGAMQDFMNKTQKSRSPRSRAPWSPGRPSNLERGRREFDDRGRMDVDQRGRREYDDRRGRDNDRGHWDGDDRRRRRDEQSRKDNEKGRQERGRRDGDQKRDGEKRKEDKGGREEKRKEGEKKEKKKKDKDKEKKPGAEKENKEKGKKVKKSAKSVTPEKVLKGKNESGGKAVAEAGKKVKEEKGFDPNEVQAISVIGSGSRSRYRESDLYRSRPRSPPSVKELSKSNVSEKSKPKEVTPTPKLAEPKVVERPTVEGGKRKGETEPPLEVQPPLKQVKTEQPEGTKGKVAEVVQDDTAVSNGPELDSSAAATVSGQKSKDDKVDDKVEAPVKVKKKKVKTEKLSGTEADKDVKVKKKSKVKKREKLPIVDDSESKVSSTDDFVKKEEPKDSVDVSGEKMKEDVHEEEMKEDVRSERTDEVTRSARTKEDVDDGQRKEEVRHERKRDDVRDDVKEKRVRQTELEDYKEVVKSRSRSRSKDIVKEKHSDFAKVEALGVEKVHKKEKVRSSKEKQLDSEAAVKKKHRSKKLSSTDVEMEDEVVRHKKKKHEHGSKKTGKIRQSTVLRDPSPELHLELEDEPELGEEALMVDPPELSKWEKDEFLSDVEPRRVQRKVHNASLRMLPRSVIESAEKALSNKPYKPVMSVVTSPKKSVKMSRRVYLDDGTGERAALEKKREQRISQEDNEKGDLRRTIIQARDLREKLNERKQGKDDDKFGNADDLLEVEGDILVKKKDKKISIKREVSTEEKKEKRELRTERSSQESDSGDIRISSVGNRNIERKISVMDEANFEPDYGGSESESSGSQVRVKSSKHSPSPEVHKEKKHKHKKHKKHKHKHKKHKHKHDKEKD